MPEGFEWPLYKDGEPVRIWDTVPFDNGSCMTLHGVELASGCYVLHGELPDGKSCQSVYPSGERVKRPKAIAADGKPLEVGQTVWRDDGEMLEVLYLRPDGLVDCCGEIERPECLTHVRPDSWEKLREDSELRPIDYCVMIGYPPSEEESTELIKNRDLVRRARALAERERGE